MILNLQKGNRKGILIPTFPGKDFAKIHSSLMFGCASSDSLNYLTLSIFSHHGVMVLR